MESNVMKVMVVDDHVPALVRISAFVNNIPGYQTISMSGDGYTLLKYLSSQKILPDIILLDVEMKKMDGVTIMEYLGVFYPGIKVIAISAYIEEPVITDMLSAGAMGYLFKDKELTLLRAALDSVLNNHTYVDYRLYFDAATRDSLVKERRLQKESLYRQYALSRREVEILSLVVSNMNYEEIGDILSIAPKTVENTVNALTKKLDICNGRAGLLLHALRLGLTKIVNLRVGAEMRMRV